LAPKRRMVWRQQYSFDNSSKCNLFLENDGKSITKFTHLQVSFQILLKKVPFQKKATGKKDNTKALIQAYIIKNSNNTLHKAYFSHVVVIIIIIGQKIRTV
jgi:hypothetical protein